MRLTLVIATLECGGAERVMTTLANAWAERGTPVTLLTTAARSEPFHPLDPRVHLVSLSGAGAWRSWAERCVNAIRRMRALRRAIRHSRPDMVISFIDKTNVMTLIASAGLGIPVIISEHGDPSAPALPRFWSQLQRWTYPRAAHIVVLNEEKQVWFPPRLRSRTSIIPNPVLPPPDSPGPAPGAPRPPFIAAVGRLIPVKGFDLLLRAFAALPDRFAEWRVVILGEGPARPELETLRHALGLDDRVDLPGQVKDPHAWLARADLFVAPSRRESFGNALCEAMASGVAVIAADCPVGARRLVMPEHDGVLVPCNDGPALSSAMARLMGDSALRQTLGANARSVAGRFALESVMTSWDNLIAAVARRRPTHSTPARP